MEISWPASMLKLPIDLYDVVVVVVVVGLSSRDRSASFSYGSTTCGHILQLPTDCMIKAKLEEEEDSYQGKAKTNEKKTQQQDK